MQETFDHIDNDLLVKYLLQEATRDEIIRVQNWLATDALNHKYYEHFKLIWEKSRDFIPEKQVDVSAAWERFHHRVHQVKKKKTGIFSIKTYQWFSIAASLLLIIGLLFLILPSKDKSGALLTVISTGSTMSDTLPDGSVITLNKNSVISYPEKFAGKNRQVALQGEAFFKVSPDKKKPFLIHVNDVAITVVGTAFNVRSHKGNTEVIVESGIVRVEKRGKIIELKAHEKVTLKPQDSLLEKQSEPDQLYNYYRTKTFLCDNTPLWKLVESLNMAYDTTIVINRQELKNIPITTTFKNESLEHILNIISQTLDITIVRENQQIILQ